MSVTSYMRGHKIFFDNEDCCWKYVDDKSVADDSRPCVRCGKYPSKEGYDACLGHIEGAVSCCCGHGIKEEGYIIMGEE